MTTAESLSTVVTSPWPDLDIPDVPLTAFLLAAAAGTLTATSTVNYGRGTTVAGTALIGASAVGRVTITNHGTGSVQILLDENASYVPGNVLGP